MRRYELTKLSAYAKLVPDWIFYFFHSPILGGIGGPANYKIKFLTTAYGMTVEKLLFALRLLAGHCFGNDDFWKNFERKIWDIFARWSFEFRCWVDAGCCVAERVFGNANF